MKEDDGNASANHEEEGEDEIITIRHYQPQDEEQVKELFVAGMMSNTRAAFFQMCCHPPNIAVLATVGGVAGWLSSSSSGNNNKRPLLLVYIPVAAISLALGAMYKFIRAGFQDYCTMSVKDDLSQISKVYQQGGGCFLVATTTATTTTTTTGIDDDKSTIGSSGGCGGQGQRQRIVGTVGLENKGPNLFELRRMSVDLNCQGKGIGNRLLQRIDEEYSGNSSKSSSSKSNNNNNNNNNKTKITLGTTSIMYAAHSLYRKNGFVITQTYPMMAQGAKGYEKYFSNLEIYIFEKELS